MRLMSGLYIGESSLASHGTAISSVADNIANSNTTGFKGFRAEFSNLMSNSEGGIYSPASSGGTGVDASSISPNMQSGSIEITGRELDAAISGDGFFVVTDGTSTYYTRAGNFGLDESGQLVTANGESVMGFTEASPDTAVAINVSGASVAPSATTSVQVFGNLDSRLEAVAEIPAADTFSALNDGSQFSSPIRVIDSLGESHEIALHFYKTDVGAWQAAAYVDGTDLGQEVSQPVSLGTANITFGETGLQAEGGGATMTINPAWGNGSAATAVTVDLSGIIARSEASAFSSTFGDGTSGGLAVGYSIESNGDLVAVLDSGESASVATLALADFNNSAGLERIGNNYFATSEVSGDAVVSRAQTEGRGEVVGGSIENSNVELSSEMLNVIRFQRGYQASSQVIQTVNEMLQRTLDIV